MTREEPSSAAAAAAARRNHRRRRYRVLLAAFYDAADGNDELGNDETSNSRSLASASRQARTPSRAHRPRAAADTRRQPIARQIGRVQI